MFPNLPREFGIKECIKHLEKIPEPHKFSTNGVIEALKITFNNNIARFNDKVYLQLTGTAMGPKNACDHAINVAMNFINQDVHNNNNQKTPPNPHVPINWNRFSVDVYIYPG